jgi:citrate synthase
VEDQFKRGKRVSGMGHAVYKTIDPRARILQSMALSVVRDHPEYRWYEMTERMALATQDILMKKKGKAIYPNVDLYSASVYHAMGIHHEFFPAVFAMSRSAGWCAHILEEKFPHPPVKPSLYRPESTYVGPAEREYVPMDER